MPLWPGATGASTPCSEAQMKGRLISEVSSNLEDPKHSLLDFSLSKVVSQNPVSGLVENREGVQAVGVPVAVICESTWNKKP